MARVRRSIRPGQVLELPHIQEAIARGFIALDGDRIRYSLHKDRAYAWKDPEEWVRAAIVAYLIVEKDYSPARMELEVPIPRRVPGDYADVVVFRDDRCKDPYIVVEAKAAGISETARAQGIEQAVGGAHSLRAPFALYYDHVSSLLLDTSGAYPAGERVANRRGGHQSVPRQYSEDEPSFRFVAAGPDDITRADARRLENKVRRTHSIIWSGGKRDPLTSFDEWSKLLFAKVHDERTTPNGVPRRFQVGSGETATAVANRIHHLFADAMKVDKSIFRSEARLLLSDDKIRDIVEVLQDVSILNTEADTIGAAFERFFGSVFRGELGQYFTMREIARFVVGAVGVDHRHFVIDPTAGSGGFLLEALLQGWHSIENDFSGQSEIERKRIEFAMQQVFGIEIHETLARILKINLLLHHDGHTNIEGDRSCLDVDFGNQRLRTSWRGGFDRVIGNPPFGDDVRAGDGDLLGTNELSAFAVARDRAQVPSEHVILERGIDMLRPGGRLAFVIPDGLLNNQGEPSNCPRVRRLLARSGVIEAIVSLPHHAFRKSGAQNKTSILMFRTFFDSERAEWDAAYGAAEAAGADEDAAVLEGLRALDYDVFLAEATHVGYTPTGQKSDSNDLYVSDERGYVADGQEGSILGELWRFRAAPGTYDGSRSPDCMSLSVVDMWKAHPSHRLDPKYFLFKREERSPAPEGWITARVGEVMRRRRERQRPEDDPDREVVVLTVPQSGDLRQRPAGKGRNPPEWRGMYFEGMPTKWYAVRSGDVVFSGIDLWKGCIAVVPDEFDGALVSGEYPVYEVVDERLDADFLSILLRSRHYRRAFRAITTGHSNRLRTQPEDFEDLEISFPVSKDEQRRLIAEAVRARRALREADVSLREAMLKFSDVIDGRGDEEYPVEEEDAPP
ncbi:MAG TPA: N-6 DNA methylase [Actinomycetota bacterium]|nr:N-6 DNA methylase [Actinomycetota bacterium]